MDLDVFVNTHHTEWDRLDHLLRRGRSLTGDEADELVALYQRTATHLSLIQSSAPDPLLTARLTQLVARARSTVTGTRRASWRDAAQFLTAGLPRRGLPFAALVDTHGSPLHPAGGRHRLVDRHPSGGPGVDRRPRGPARPDAAGWRVRDVLLKPPGRVLRRAGLDEQRPGGSHVPGPGGVPLPTGGLDPLRQCAQPGRRDRADVLHAAAWTPSSGSCCPTDCSNSPPSSSQRGQAYASAGRSSTRAHGLGARPWPSRAEPR